MVLTAREHGSYKPLAYLLSGGKYNIWKYRSVPSPSIADEQADRAKKVKGVKGVKIGSNSCFLQSVREKFRLKTVVVSV